MFGRKLRERNEQLHLEQRTAIAEIYRVVTEVRGDVGELRRAEAARNREKLEAIQEREREARVKDLRARGCIAPDAAIMLMDLEDATRQLRKENCTSYAVPFGYGAFLHASVRRAGTTIAEPMLPLLEWCQKTHPDLWKPVKK